MYHKTTPFIVFMCNKKIVHEIFLKSKMQIMQLKTLISILGFIKYFPTSSGLIYVYQIYACFCVFSNTKYFKCFVLQQPKQIKQFKSLSEICTNRLFTEPGFWFYLAKSAQLGGQRLALGNQRFPVRVRLPAMCRGELSAAIARLMSKCL